MNDWKDDDNLETRLSRVERRLERTNIMLRNVGVIAVVSFIYISWAVISSLMILSGDLMAINIVASLNVFFAVVIIVVLIVLVLWGLFRDREE